MGVEYRISCPPEKLPKLEEFLRRAGGKPSEQYPDQLEFRFRPSGLDVMPDATAMIEPAGVYFCDHCGAREPINALFRQLIDEALACSDASDSLTITAL